MKDSSDPKLRLALIKQEYYPDLYVCEPSRNDFYKCSPFRSGPLGLVTEFEVDFYIVKEYNSAECRVWREKIQYMKHRSEENWLSIPDTYSYQGRTQRDCSIDVELIDFSKYDVVICFDIAVPSAIVSAYPSILWCYYITEPPMPAYRESVKNPLFGYDIFLNQRFRRHSDFFKDPSTLEPHHSIDFPYTLASSRTYKQLFDINREARCQNEKAKVVIPKYVIKQIDPDDINRLCDSFELISPSGDIGSYLTMLAEADFYFRPGNDPRFGNESVEAVASGNIFIASPWGWKNRIFNLGQSSLDPKLSFFDQVLSGEKLILGIANDATLQERLRIAQRELLDDLCYRRPISNLINAYYHKALGKPC